MAATVFDHLKEAFVITTLGLEPKEYYRRLLTRLIQATGIKAATLWVLEQDELVLLDHLETQQGVLKDVNFPEDRQAEGLKKVFAEGQPQVFLTGQDGEPRDRRHTLVFLRINGMERPAGVVRLIAPALGEAELQSLVSFTDCWLSYCVLYETLRQGRRQSGERSILEKLGRSSVAIHSAALSTRFAATAVNTATEVIDAERVSLLVPGKNKSMRLEAVSSVDSPDAKSAWNRALTEMSEEALTLERPLRYVEAVTDINDVPTHIREKLVAYVQISGCKTILVLPLRARTGPNGVLVMESWAKEPIQEFETASATVYAQHVAIALDNQQFFNRLPFASTFARRRERELSRAKPRKPLGRQLKWIFGGIVAVVLIGYFGFVTVPETVSCECQVVPSEEATVVPKIPGEISKVNVVMGSQVKRGEVVFELNTDRLRLAQAKLKFEIEQIQLQRQRLLADAAQLERSGQEGGSKIAEARAKEAEENAKQQELALVEMNLADSKVVSPIDGVVMEPSEPEQLVGRVVNKGDPLCRIANLGTVRIDVAVKEPDLYLVDVGQKVQIMLESRLTEKHIDGEIRHLHIRSAPFKNQNVFFAEVFVPNPDGTMKRGMTGKALVTVGRSTYVWKWYRRAVRKIQYWWF